MRQSRRRRARNTALRLTAFAIAVYVVFIVAFMQPGRMSAGQQATPAAHRRLALQLGVIALGAFGFGFALVPLYDVLCSVTGYGDRTRTDAGKRGAHGGRRIAHS